MTQSFESSAKNVHEASSIKFAPSPTDKRDWPKWWLKERKRIVAASGRTQNQVFWWISKITLPGVTFEMLKDSEGLDTLDMKIGQGATENAFGIFLREITLAEAKSDREEGRMLNGRQILWMKAQHYIRSELDVAISNYRHLEQVRLKGDDLKWSDLGLGFNAPLGCSPNC